MNKDNHSRQTSISTARSPNLRDLSDWSTRFEDYLFKRENELNG